MLLQKQLQAQGFDVPLGLIDLLIGGDGLQSGLHVLLDQRIRGAADGTLDQRTHFQQLVVERVELLVKMVSHQPNLPVM